MAITLHGSGGLFTRLGAVLQALNDENASRGGSLTVDGRATDVSATLVTKFNTLETALAAGTALYVASDGLQATLAAYQSGGDGSVSALKDLAQVILINQANNDTKLTSLDAKSALNLLITQMVSGSAYVKANVPALGSQTSVGSPTGTPVVVGSVKSGTGKYSGQEYAIAETIYATCTSDAQSGGATAYQEEITFSGQNAQANKLSWDWPKGSGAGITLNCADGNSDNSGQNVLQNSGFETWTTSNVADNWTILVGTAGTDFKKEAVNFYSDGGAAAAQFVAGTGVNTSITQVFNTTPAAGVGAGGTAYNIAALPDVPFAVNLYARRDGVVTAGVITVDLIDGSGTIIADDNSANNTFAVAFGSLTTSYVAFNGVFRLPASVPSTVKLRIRASTAITGANILVDRVAMSQMTRLYEPHGPWLAVFSSGTKALVGDTWTMALTISAAGAFQRGFQKLFDIDELGLYLPSKSDGSETELDSLIV